LATRNDQLTYGPLLLEPATTALVLVDLQSGTLQMHLEPHTADDVVASARRLADSFRDHNALVILIRAGMSRDHRDLLNPQTDRKAFSGTRGPDWTDPPPGLGQKESDLVITKRQWGAFFGTDLDLQLRRRGITTVVIGGVSTNFGVESTARAAVEHGYQAVFAADAMSGFTAEAHRFAIESIFPFIGLVRSVDDVIEALGSDAERRSTDGTPAHPPPQRVTEK
jgi:nicotinamidase-related amidase